MDRQIVYPGSIPLDTDILSVQRNTMVALGYLAQATLGRGPLVDGLACTPTSPPGLTVTVGPGSITVLSVVDASAFGSLPVDAVDPLVKMGIAVTPTTFTLTAPATSGQSINYLVQAALSETDANPVVLPYYNAANPAQPFSGASNNGAGQNTQRLQRVQLELKSSPPANAGSQVTPAVDNGWVGLHVITVNYGQNQIGNSSIAVYPEAPFIAFKLNSLTPGFSRLITFSSAGSFTVPIGSSAVRLRLCGGGGGGGAGAVGVGSGGGGAGGYAEGVVSVQPGEVIQVTVGAPGSGGVVGGSSSQAGGSSSFGNFISATGGAGGDAAESYSFGGNPGIGIGGSINVVGGYGSDGNGGSFTFAGNGGASFFGGGGRAASVGSATQQGGTAPGSGGGGCYGVSGNGGNGASGVVIVEY